MKFYNLTKEADKIKNFPKYRKDALVGI